MAQRSSLPALTNSMILVSVARGPMRTGDGRMPTSRICRYGPGRVRDGKKLRDAIALLSEHGRAWMEEEERRRFEVVNPVLCPG
jgi:hypothetical protein